MSRTGGPRFDAPSLIRTARPEDAPRISGLYRQVYASPAEGDPADVYPFPQLMVASSVAAMVGGDEIAWVVAEEANGSIIGSAGAVRNIGGEKDRIAEIFGVVVDESTRCRGVGSALLTGLIERLSDSTEFFLCEARTAVAGGWKVARNAGFLPVGFEPYAHAMPIGFESMILTARTGRCWQRSWNAAGPRPNPGQRGSVLRLADSIGIRPLVSSERNGPGDGDELQSSTCAECPRNDEREVPGFASRTEPADGRSGVIALRPLLGVDETGRRFKQDDLVINYGPRAVGTARIVSDRIDSKARILGLRVAEGSDRRPVLRAVVDHLSGLASGGPLITVVWVLGGEPQLHEELESFGFTATAYLPGMVAGPSGRRDVVQYSMFLGRSLPESTIGVTALDWPEARAVIHQVAFGNERASLMNLPVSPSSPEQPPSTVAPRLS